MRGTVFAYSAVHSIIGTFLTSLVYTGLSSNIHHFSSLVIRTEFSDITLKTKPSSQITSLKSTSALKEAQHIGFLVRGTESFSAIRIAKFRQLITALMIAPF
jgi:hypothetical protein